MSNPENFGRNSLQKKTHGILLANHCAWLCPKIQVLIVDGFATCTLMKINIQTHLGDHNSSSHDKCRRSQQGLVIFLSNV